MRVLEQYIKDMSIQNMQRMQASNGSEKWEKEVEKKDEEIAKLKAVLVAQGNELTETKSDLERLSASTRRSGISWKLAVADLRITPRAT